MTVNMYNGIIIPVDVIEGAISIGESASVKGDNEEPMLANKAHKGNVMAIVGDFQVEVATGSNGTIIGFMHDHPEYDVDPTTPYTKTQAISACMLRHGGVETSFKDVRTVTAKTSENIKAGNYVKYGADGQSFEKSATETNMIALAGQNAENKIVIGIK